MLGPKRVLHCLFSFGFDITFKSIDNACHILVHSEHGILSLTWPVLETLRT